MIYFIKTASLLSTHADPLTPLQPGPSCRGPNTRPHSPSTASSRCHFIRRIGGPTLYLTSGLEKLQIVNHSLSEKSGNICKDVVIRPSWQPIAPGERKKWEFLLLNCLEEEEKKRKKNKSASVLLTHTDLSAFLL